MFCMLKETNTGIGLKKYFTSKDNLFFCSLDNHLSWITQSMSSTGKTLSFFECVFLVVLHYNSTLILYVYTWSCESVHCRGLPKPPLTDQQEANLSY